MKKLTAFGLAFAASLLFVAPAFAAPVGSLCPDSLGTICTSTEGVGPLLGKVINFFFIVAVILAFGFLVYGGIRWITSGGDKAGVENARNTIIAAIVGLIVVFLSYIILNFVLGLFGMNLNALSFPSLIEQGAGTNSPQPQRGEVRNACQDCGTKGNKACPAACPGDRCKSGKLDGNKCK